MFSLLQRSIEHLASVHYRGNLAPRAEEYDFLRRQGFEITPASAGNDAHWRLTLGHPQAGEAELFAAKAAIPLQREWIQVCASLTQREKDELAAGGTGVTVRLRSKKGSVLRDRKNLFKVAHAVMGDDAVGMADHGSELFWSRAGLADELSLPGDPDVSVLYCIHAVVPNPEEGGADEEETPYWLHTHGLEGIGAFDYDILKPSPGLAEHCEDPMRCLAYFAVEGEAKVDTPRLEFASPGGAVRCVPVKEFHQRASEADRKLHDLATHGGKRAMLCECSGLGTRLFGSVRPSRFLSKVDPDGIVLHFSKAASEAMAAKARATVKCFAALREELREFEAVAVAKFGYPMDHDPDSQEHLWFEVHDVRETTMDATLVNQPHDIARMSPGDRGEHPIERLTEWTLITPAGKVSAHNRLPLRRLREDPERARAIVAEANRLAREEGGGA